MKSILIDLYKTRDLYSGLGQFSLNFAKEIIVLHPANYFFSFLIPRNLRMETGPNAHLIRTTFQHRYFPSLNKKFDLWHSLQQFPSHMPNRKTPFILTIHDLNFLQDKDHRKASRYLRRLQHNVDRADALTVISHHTKSALEAHVNLKGKPIRVIYDGVTVTAFDHVQPPPYAPTAKFFFSLGVFKESKNFHSLLPVIDHFPEHHLIIAGNHRTDYGEYMKRIIREMNLSSRIHLPGVITEQEKFWLYDHCEAFLFPSKAEGFGLPVIEAMKAGRPVFLSRFGSLPEIGGGLAYYLDSFEPLHITAVIKEKLDCYHRNPKELSDQLKRYATKFDWKSCIEQYLAFYEEVIFTTAESAI